MNFKDEFNYWVIKLELTDKQVMKLFGVCLPTIIRWKTGENEPYCIMAELCINGLKDIWRRRNIVGTELSEKDIELQSSKDIIELTDAIENPPEPNEKLKNAANKYMQDCENMDEYLFGRFGKK